MITGPLNWGVIQSGATFERMVSNLVFFVSPGAHLLGRRGPDGGQDAISADGTMVWQAKHHVGATASDAIRDAKDELGKVRRYRDPTHKRSRQWSGVTDWVLATNAEFGRTDVDRWKDEVVPAFKAEGMNAKLYWDAARLEALLNTYPHVREAFFGGRTHAFQSISEAGETLRAQERFLERAVDCSLVGRTQELEAARSFLADESQSFLLVSGRGGVGKTRFLYEFGCEVAGRGERDVYWANVLEMAASSDWYRGMVPERPVLLLVDEPEDDQLLGRLVDQVRQAGSRAHGWKVVVAVRSWRDPVIRFFTGSRLTKHTASVELSALAKSEGMALAESLLGSGPLVDRSGFQLAEAAEALARRFDHHPVWIALGVWVLERHGDLSKVPHDASALAQEYLDEAVGTDAQSLHGLGVLRWTALLGVVNREANGLIGHLGERLGLAAIDLLAEYQRLVSRRALDERGARNRLVEVKPDVIRDQLLREWLVVEVGGDAGPFRPSSTADGLMTEILEGIRVNRLGELERSALLALARTDGLLRPEGVDAGLMVRFFDGLSAMLPELGAERRAALADLVAGFAAVVPNLVVAFSRSQRQLGCAPEEREGHWRTIRTSHDDIVASLPRMVFHAGQGAAEPSQRTLVVDELAVLATEEARIERGRDASSSNQGKGSAELLRRLVGDSYGGFDQAVGEYVVAQLGKIAAGRVLDPDQAVALVAISAIATDVTRRADEVTGDSFVFRQYIPPADFPMWRHRAAIVSAVMACLAERSVADQSMRRVLWKLLVDAKHGAVSHLPAGSDGDRLNKASLEILEFAHALLSASEIPAGELRAARAIWSWYAKFDPDSERGGMALELEQLVRSHSVAGVLEPLVGEVFQDEEWLKSAISSAVEQLDEASASEIAQFIAQAEDYTSADRHLSRLGWVAQGVGRKLLAWESGIGSFLKSRLGGERPRPWERWFAVQAAVGWVEATRADDPGKAVSVVQQLLGVAVPAAAAQLLRALYGGYPGRLVDQVADSEVELVTGSAQWFVEAGDPVGYFSVVGWSLLRDEKGMKAAVETALQAQPEEAQGDCIATLIDSVGDTVGWARRREPPRPLPTDLGEWMLTVAGSGPGLSAVSSGGMSEHHLREIFRSCGRPSPAWVVRWLQQRRRRVSTSGNRLHLRGLSAVSKVTQFVVPVAGTPASTPRWACDLLALVGGSDDVARSMPEIVRDLDPHGHVLPKLVAEHVETRGNGGSVPDDWAELATAYEVNSAAWRTVAEVVLRLDRSAEGSVEREHLYWCLTNRGFRTFTSRPGEVAPVYQADVDAAAKRLSRESTPELRALWQWQLKQAKDALKGETELVKERRGE